MSFALAVSHLTKRLSIFSELFSEPFSELFFEVSRNPFGVSRRAPATFTLKVTTAEGPTSANSGGRMPAA